MKFKNVSTVLLAATITLGAGALAGCRTYSSSSTARTEEAVVRRPSISVSGPGRDLLAGDTATFVASTANTYGRDAHIRWSSTAGRITTDEGGSVARVQFGEAGTYTVKATLEVDGAPLQTEAIDVRVNPVR